MISWSMSSSLLLIKNKIRGAYACILNDKYGWFEKNYVFMHKIININLIYGYFSSA